MTIYTSAIQLHEDQSVWASLFTSSTCVLQGETLQNFRGRTLAVLSPRAGEACFSLGAFLAHLSSGHLISQDTSSQNTGNSGEHEDAAFAARCRLTRHAVSDETGALACVERIAAAIPAGQRGILLSPLGIGPDAGRRALSSLVAEQLPRLHRNYDVYFYEELPDASRILARELTVQRLRRRVALSTRYAYPARWWCKRELLEFYSSRLSGYSRPARFNPAVLSPAFSHEAFWSVSR